jgi:hypothetical protein
LRQAGFVFSLRYPSRADQEPAGDLTRDEAAAILGAGLALMPVQHVAPEGWEPGADLGTTNGRNAVANAKIVDFPTGINLWLDLERVATDAAVQDVIDYCNAWFAEVDGAGFISGRYVGPQRSSTAISSLSSCAPNITGRPQASCRRSKSAATRWYKACTPKSPA